ncbi:MAG: hemerythrin domain-containing protein [Myxococcales bacterium]|nr:hemerythrin domain-containing protein [Myxococcales bacterium]
MPLHALHETLSSEHAGLRKRLRDLLELRDAAALAAELGALAALLASHFAGEEAEGGLFATLASSLPEATVAQLRADHREIEATLAEVVALVSRPGATVPVPVVHALVATVAEHERRENTLFQEHLERDVGSGD